MHLKALEVGWRMQFNEMSAVMLVFLMHLQALEVGLRMHFNDMSAVILTIAYLMWFE